MNNAIELKLYWSQEKSRPVKAFFGDVDMDRIIYCDSYSKLYFYDNNTNNELGNYTGTLSSSIYKFQISRTIFNNNYTYIRVEAKTSSGATPSAIGYFTIIPQDIPHNSEDIYGKSLKIEGDAEITGNTTMGQTTYKNCNPDFTASCCYGLYQWNNNYQYTLRDINNVYKASVFEIFPINASDLTQGAYVGFSNIPKVNNTNVLLQTGGTLTGQLVAQNNTNYTTKQVRNITISTGNPSGGSNGDIWIKYIN